MQFFRRLFARLRSLYFDHRAASPRQPELPLVVTYLAPIYREVSRNGVRVFSLCSCCGARLQASATLCEECAQKQAGPARPF